MIQKKIKSTLTADVLKDLYETQKMTLQAIGDLYGITKQYVHILMVEYKIKRRKHGLIPKRHDIRSIKKLIKEGYTPGEIQKTLGISCALYFQIRQRFHIGPPRFIRYIPGVNYSLFENREWLKQVYLKKGWSTTRIAEFIGVKSYQGVTRRLRQFGIPVRPKGRY